ncbi:MAG: hypothetical protein PHR14_02685 [Oscillospiraceae bacterium]|nr:hypothetical protein [Oscillospiraceae bacterium]
MSTVDLKNYLYDGGIILFVVYIGGGGLIRKIYYEVYIYANVKGSAIPQPLEFIPQQIAFCSIC